MRTPGSDKIAGFASATPRNRCDLERGPHTKCVGIHNPSAATKIQTARVAVVLFLYYDLGPVVKPRDDTTALKPCGAGKGEINTAQSGGGVNKYSGILLFCN